MKGFTSKILILPGLGNSGAGHWQTLWEKQFDLIRVNQNDWETPVREDWVERLETTIKDLNSADIILVGHSLACSLIGFWAMRTNLKIKGALLVAPSDTEAPSYPPGTTGFTPMPTGKLPFPSITVASTNDFYVTIERAKYFASMWGSELVVVGEAGHINVSAGFGEWSEGLEYLSTLDNR